MEGQKKACPKCSSSLEEGESLRGFSEAVNKTRSCFWSCREKVSFEKVQIEGADPQVDKSSYQDKPFIVGEGK